MQSLGHMLLVTLAVTKLLKSFLKKSLELNKVTKKKGDQKALCLVEKL